MQTGVFSVDKNEKKVTTANIQKTNGKLVSNTDRLSEVKPWLLNCGCQFRCHFSPIQI